MKMEMEPEKLSEVEGQMRMEANETRPERTASAEVHVIFSDFDSNLRRNESLPRFTRELTSLTESFAGATQLLSSSSPTHMSVDDDSAST
jgi:hypothetical protein